MRSTSPTRAAARALTLLLAGLLGCSDGGKTDDDELLGVVLVVLDTVRADHVSCYGYERPTTPVIDALAADGVRFERALSSAPWTLPSVGALLAGDHPAKAFDQETKMTRSLVERLQAAGVATAAVTEGGYVSRHFGMDRGFDSYHEEEGPVRVLETGEQPVDPAQAGASLERVFSTAEAWLTERSRAENGRAPFFLFVHTYEPHTPYTSRVFAEGMDVGRIGPVLRIEHLAGLRSGRIALTEAEHAYGVALYDGDVRSADDRLGKLLEHLERLGIAERVAVIVTSDHGEELGDGYPLGVFDHGHSLRDDLLHAPLVVRDPTGSYPKRSVKEQVGLVDVLPTVCALLGVDPGEEVAGRSLLPLMRGAPEGDRVVCSFATKRGPARASIQNGRFKLVAVKGPAPANAAPLGVELPEHQLFDLEVDPGEMTNVASEHPQLVGALAEALDQWLLEGQAATTGIAPRVDDAALRSRLESLGYTE